MYSRLNGTFLAAAAFAAAMIAAGCGAGQPKPGTVLDEAMRAGRTADVVPGRRRGLLPRHGRRPAALEGRGPGPQHVDRVDRRQRSACGTSSRSESLGSLDFLKTLSSHPGCPTSRDNRWNYLGLVNEPCFKKATGPDPNRYGLWLDVRDPPARPDPFANAAKYPGVQIGARGRTVPVGSYYGEPSGVVGLRLFPNPDFDEAARKAWDAERYYRDPSYYERPGAGAGRTASACRAASATSGPNPVRPPADPENPKWENLSSNVGAQYFWWDRIFDWKARHQRRAS